MGKQLSKYEQAHMWIVIGLSGLLCLAFILKIVFF